ncbi:MAG TPA: secretin N-terminal domain-containing protein [Verrucomicrobiota bacterium]|nr:secretin N-terminal domain-containing protein [Verrucomicrobiota bacterium]HNT15056.1 secretin N-terminal domain-containing protein [Verrucomicrobiota bacterium]
MKVKILPTVLLLLFSLSGMAQTPPPATPAPARPTLSRPATRTLPVSPTNAPASHAAAGLPDLGALMARPPATVGTVPDPDKMMEANSINWTAASLENVLEIYAELVGRNVLQPATLPKAEIVLKQTTPLTKLEVVQMIEAALYLNQISLVNVGDKFVTVIPTAEAVKIPGIINTNAISHMPDLGSVVTHVVQLKYTKPSEMVQVLQPFASGSVATPITPLEGSSILVLRDNVANVKRMLEMIERVDTVAESEILSEVIPIKFAKAEEIASALSSVGGGTAGSIGTRASGSAGRSAGMNRGGMGMGNTGFNNPMLNPMGAGAATQNPTPSSSTSFGDRVRNLINRAAGAGEFTILGETKIIADIRSNSLLVFAAKRDMDMIKDIIAKLDVVLAQVLIETIIMDVSLDNSWAFGVSGAQKARQFSGGFSGAGGMNLKRFTEVGNSSSSLGTNAFTDLIGTGLKYFGVVDQDIYLSIEAAAADNKINVIQKPRIQTSHATPASIFIGNTVPYVTSTYYGGGYAGGPGSSYQQLRVGIGLDVTPFINSDGLVVMQIQETIDEISGSTDITGVGAVPNTTSRTLSAEVAVNDRESIMLGGFIRNSDNQNKSGVPILKDIPLLGALFRSSGSSKERKELMVLMRPTVLRTPSIAALQVNEEKKRLPGVVAAEKQLDKTERALAEQEVERTKSGPKQKPAKTEVKSDQDALDDFTRSRPFTPEEELLLGEPSQPAAK